MDIHVVVFWGFLSITGYLIGGVDGALAVLGVGFGLSLLIN